MRGQVLTFAKVLVYIVPVADARRWEVPNGEPHIRHLTLARCLLMRNAGDLKYASLLRNPAELWRFRCCGDIFSVESIAVGGQSSSEHYHNMGGLTRLATVHCLPVETAIRPPHTNPLVDRMEQLLQFRRRRPETSVSRSRR